MKNKFSFKLFLFLTLTFHVYTDTVVFKDGNTIENAKAYMLPSDVKVLTSDGGNKVYSKKVLKTINFAPVVWNSKKKEPEFEEILRVSNELNKFNQSLKEELEEIRNDMLALKKTQDEQSAKIEEIQSNEGIGEIRKRSWGYLRKSALVPGWGQYSRGEDTKNMLQVGKATFFFFGSLVLLSNSFSSYSKYKEARSQADSVVNIALLSPSGSSLELLSLLQVNQAREQLSQAGANFNLASGLMLGFYAANLLDAFFLGRPKAVEIKPTAFNGFSFSLRHEPSFSSNISTNDQRIVTQYSFQF